MKNLAQLTFSFIAMFAAPVFAADSGCEFPLLDTKTEVTSETCKQLKSEPYQKKMLDYVCSSSCTDLDQCLENFDTMRKDPKVVESLASVESTTASYPKERRIEKCGQYEPNPPVDTKDDTLWDNFRKFVEARRHMNKLLKTKIASVKNECIRRDNTGGAYMRFVRTDHLKTMLTQCKSLAQGHEAQRETGSTQP